MLTILAMKRRWRLVQHLPGKTREKKRIWWSALFAKDDDASSALLEEEEVWKWRGEEKKKIMAEIFPLPQNRDMAFGGVGLEWREGGGEGWSWHGKGRVALFCVQVQNKNSASLLLPPASKEAFWAGEGAKSCPQINQHLSEWVSEWVTGSCSFSPALLEREREREREEDIEHHRQRTSDSAFLSKEKEKHTHTHVDFPDEK